MRKKVSHYPFDYYVKRNSFQLYHVNLYALSCIYLIINLTLYSIYTLYYSYLHLSIYIYSVYALAESKKETANQYYSLKQYKKALVGYNEVICTYQELLRKSIIYQSHITILRK